MALKVTTALKKPGVFVVAPVGSIDTTSHRILEEKVEAVLQQSPISSSSISSSRTTSTAWGSGSW